MFCFGYDTSPRSELFSLVALRLDNLRWVDGGTWKRLEPDSLAGDSNQVVVVDAGSTAGVELLAEVLIGAAELKQGTIRYADTEITLRRAEDIGLVPAGGGLFPHLTVRENIRCGRRISETVVDYIARRFELHGGLERRPEELTSEQRARVAVARANCKDIVKVLVIEDRTRLSCHDAVRAAQRYCPDTALIIVTDSPAQVTTFRSDTVWRVESAD